LRLIHYPRTVFLAGAEGRRVELAQVRKQIAFVGALAAVAAALTSGCGDPEATANATDAAFVGG
jgi:hypothetical protein